MLRALAVTMLLASPVTAGQVEWVWSPRTGDEAAALRTGLALYALREQVRSGGSVRQWGRDNAAALVQRGSGNWGAVVQRGEGHAARLTQEGGGNVGAVVQIGRGARADIAQRGGETGVTVQVGW
jgi:hypothetical protein